MDLKPPHLVIALRNANNAHLRLLHNLALGSCGSSLIEYLGSLLKMRILKVAPPVVVLPMVVPPYFAKPVLVLSLI